MANGYQTTPLIKEQAERFRPLAWHRSRGITPPV